MISGTEPAPRRSPVVLLADVVLPLAIYYAARGAGLGPWGALLVGALVAAGGLLWTAVRHRSLRTTSLLALTLMVAGTVTGLISAEPRLMMARGSWVTVVVGLWLLASVGGRRPALFTATVPFMTPQASTDWERAWSRDPRFRCVLRSMTAAFGAAFLIDAVARVVMAYTLPLDSVPILSSVLLLGMLTGIVLTGRAVARRRPS